MIWADRLCRVGVRFCPGTYLP